MTTCWSSLLDDIKQYHLFPYLTLHDLLSLDTASSSIADGSRDRYIQMLRYSNLPTLTNRKWSSISSLHWLQKRGVSVPNLQLDNDCVVNFSLFPCNSLDHVTYLLGFKDIIRGGTTIETGTSGLIFLQPLTGFFKTNDKRQATPFLLSYIKYSRTRQIKAFYAHLETEEHPGFRKAKKGFLSSGNNEDILMGYIDFFGHIDFNIFKYLIQMKTYDINETHRDGSTVLLKSCMEDAVEETRYLVAQGANTDVEDDEGMSCLSVAARYNRIETLTYLLVDLGMDIDQISYLTGKTALDTAIISGCIESVEFLLDNGASLTREEGKTPWMWALSMGNLDIIELLRERGCDVTAERPAYSPMMHQKIEMLRPLMCLVTEGFQDIGRANRPSVTIATSYGFFAEAEKSDKEMTDSNCNQLVPGVGLERDTAESARTDRVLSLLLELIEEKGCAIEGIPVLSSAILLILKVEKYSMRDEHSNRMVVIGRLIEMGATIEDDDFPEVLWSAIMSNNLPIVDLLLQKGYSMPTYEGISMVHDLLNGTTRESKGIDIIINEDSEILSILLERGVDVNQQNVNGDTASHCACRRDDYEQLVPVLLKHGADFSIINHAGNTVWHTTIEAGDSDLAAFILENASITNDMANKKNNKGFTPLAMCCKRGIHTVISLLIDMGADVNVKACKYTGNTPLHDAAHIGYIETVRVLLDYKADTEVQNNHGLKPVDLATEHPIVVLLRGKSGETLKQYHENNKTFRERIKTIRSSSVKKETRHCTIM